MKYISHHPLTKDHQIQAIFRYFYFHLRQIINGRKPVIYKFIDGINFYASMGEAGIVGNIYCGLADFEEMSFLLHFLRPDDLFVDIGANVGAYTLLASGVCRCKTIAIEPIPSTFKKLEMNIRLNGLLNEKVDILNVGAGKEKGSIYFLDSKNGAMNRVITKNDPISIPKTKVMTLPLDILLMDHMKPRMIKIDVEGFEYEVLKGAEKCLQNENLKAIIIELNQSGKMYGYDDEEIVDFLQRMDFYPYQYEPFSISLKKIETKNIESFNTLFIRDINVVSARLQAAPRRKILSSLV